MSTPTQNHVVIIGASYAGLCAAVAFQANGWRATVVERSAETLRSGGGVVVQPQMSRYLESHNLDFPGVSSVPATMRVLYQPDGTVLHFPETARAYTAWDVLLRQFEISTGEANIKRGRGLTDIEILDAQVVAVLEGGERLAADLLVGADGLGSTVRRILLPGSDPTYAGYVAWRGTIPIADLSAEVCEACENVFSTYTGSQTNIVAYQIPGASGSIAPKERRLNWVWYLNADEGEELDAVLAGVGGHRKRSTLPRGEARPETIIAIRELAREMLPEPFASVVRATPEPFAQAILDYQAPRLFFDRSVLIGDAACIIRPHLGAGTAKAVQDAASLADAVCGPDFRDRGCLRAWQQVRLEDHHAMAEQARAVARRAGLGAGRTRETLSVARHQWV